MFKPLSIALLAGLSALPSHADTNIGYISGELHTELVPRDLMFSVWYPTEATHTPVTVTGNAVFVGQEAQDGAPMAEGSHPMVILSHGGLRSAADSGAWLAAGLAHEGFVVVEVNGPRARNAEQALAEFTERPTDVARMIDLMLGSADLPGEIDSSNLSVVGYALGGTAALSLAGGVMDSDAFVQSCDQGLSPDCGWFEAQGVSLAQVNAEDLAQSQHDPRITSVVAIDPEYAGLLSYGPDALPEADRLVIELGAGQIEGATPFDGFPICTDRGGMILAEDGGNAALCEAPDRARVHEAIVDMVAAHLTR